MDKREIIDLVLKQEGFYNNNFGYISAAEAKEIGDRGGETYGGISKRAHPNWEGWAIINKSETLPDLTEMVIDFYDKNYYSKVETPYSNINLILFSSAVNCGIKRACKFLQYAINSHSNGGRRASMLTVDGILGEKTLTSLNALKDRMSAVEISTLVNLGAYYHKLDSPQFTTGWINRVGKIWRSSNSTFQLD